MTKNQPTPGDLPAWATYWQDRGAMLARAARDARDNRHDAILWEMYQEAAATCYSRARHLVSAMRRTRGA